MANYRVGQILYVIPGDNPNVVPVKVRERRLSETEAGTSTQHIVQTPKQDAPLLKLETIKGMVFEDLNEARRIMLSNAQRAIDGMIQRANAIANQCFGPGQQGQQTAMVAQKQVVDDDPFDTSGVLIETAQSVQVSQNKHPKAVEQNALPLPESNIDMDDMDMSAGTEVQLADGQIVKLSS